MIIRRATKADSPALSKICLLTADAGESAEHLHTMGELPGLMWAEPYVHVPSAVGFVLVDPSSRPEPNHLPDNGTTKATTTATNSGSTAAGHEADDEGAGNEGEEVVGYILSAFDTRSYEREVEESWFPPLRSRYPNPDPPSREDVPSNSYATATAEATPLPEMKDADLTYLRFIHNTPRTEQSVLKFSPAHMHIDILPAYQSHGWGRKLIGKLVEYLREEKGLDALWLGMDVRNVKARRFYEHLGFKPVEGAPSHIMGLRFQEWGK